MDRLTPQQRSYTMSRIHQSGTAFEKKVFRELRRRRVYFQKHYARVMGKPDIAVPTKKRAVFLHSDFWHGWQYGRWKDVLPSRFWIDKIESNRKRDVKVKRSLRRLGWEVLVIWEHSLRSNPERTMGKIVKFLKGRVVRR